VSYLRRETQARHADEHVLAVQQEEMPVGVDEEHLMKINWALFSHSMPCTLCVGEEKTLTPEEIRKANELIGTLFSAKTELLQIFNDARTRFAKEVR
jgi:hypothetical protein